MDARYAGGYAVPLRAFNAGAGHFMTHLSITEATGDTRPEADWGEHVTDDEYDGR